jgi:hypothetical protein
MRPSRLTTERLHKKLAGLGVVIRALKQGTQQQHVRYSYEFGGVRHRSLVKVCRAVGTNAPSRTCQTCKNSRARTSPHYECLPCDAIRRGDCGVPTAAQARVLWLETKGIRVELRDRTHRPGSKFYRCTSPNGGHRFDSLAAASRSLHAADDAVTSGEAAAAHESYAGEVYRWKVCETVDCGRQARYEDLERVVATGHVKRVLCSVCLAGRLNAHGRTRAAFNYTSKHRHDPRALTSDPRDRPTTAVLAAILAQRLRAEQNGGAQAAPLLPCG